MKFSTKFSRPICYLMVISYFLAGINHFVNPKFYFPLFPSYLQNWATELNFIAGLAEIILAILLLFGVTRKIAATLIIAMLLTFLPIHIYFIEVKSCIPNSNICVPEWIGWFRLLIIHPILIFWAYFVGNLKFNYPNR